MRFLPLPTLLFWYEAASCMSRFGIRISTRDATTHCTWSYHRSFSYPKKEHNERANAQSIIFRSHTTMHHSPGSPSCRCSDSPSGCPGPRPHAAAWIAPPTATSPTLRLLYVSVGIVPAYPPTFPPHLQHLPHLLAIRSQQRGRTHRGGITASCVSVVCRC